MSPYGLSQALGIEQTKAAEYILHYFEVHKGIKAYCERMVEEAREKGYVETLFGFKRHLPNINSPYRVQAESEERMAINMPVQGTAAEILKLAMIELSDKLKNLRTEELKNKNKCHSERSEESQESEILRLAQRAPLGAQDDKQARLLLTVHDELVVEAPDKDAEKISKIVKNTMENVIKLCVPVEVEVGIGKNWAESKS
jgi:DNA polymerase-1